MKATLSALADLGWTGPLDRLFAEALGRIAGEPDPAVLLGAAVASRFVSEKHVCVDLGRLAGRPVVGFDGEEHPGLTWPVLDEWCVSLSHSRLVTAGEALAPLVLVGDRLYLHRYWDYERRLAAELARRSASEVSVVDEELLETGIARCFPRGTTADLQREAAAIAVRRLLTVISGGPGTGKTTAVARLLRLLVEQAIAGGDRPPRISLLAPTGKAAARLTESIRQLGDRAVDELGPGSVVAIPIEAVTIHRALGWRPGGWQTFRHDFDNPLPADVVVVDEASMVDLALMTRLVDAVPRTARLILLGDRDQLASVDAGSVLGDICNAGADRGPESPRATGLDRCVVHLTHSYRFGARSSIGQLARAINDNRPDEALALLGDDSDEAATRVVEAHDSEEIEKLVAVAAADRFRSLLSAGDVRSRLTRFEEFRVLCAHRRGPVGAERIGQAIERRLRDLGLIADVGGWYDGKPVLITQNDYQIGLFNGDTGLTCIDAQTGRLCVMFSAPDGGLRAVSPSRITGYESAFASSVHKAQGSEFDEVSVVLPIRASAVVTRELLYTAVTRARSSVTVYGTKQVIREAIRTPTTRMSGLQELLWG